MKAAKTPDSCHNDTHTLHIMRFNHSSLCYFFAPCRARGTLLTRAQPRTAQGTQPRVLSAARGVHNAPLEEPTRPGPQFSVMFSSWNACILVFCLFALPFLVVAVYCTRGGSFLLNAACSYAYTVHGAHTSPCDKLYYMKSILISCVDA